MSDRKPGDRVGAIAKIEEGNAEFYGYGIYEGDKIPDISLNVQFMGVPLMRPNPCILLDSGEYVYGCECWWGPEEAIKAKLAACKKVVEVSPQEQRRKYNRPVAD